MPKNIYAWVSPVVEITSHKVLKEIDFTDQLLFGCSVGENPPTSYSACALVSICNKVFLSNRYVISPVQFGWAGGELDWKVLLNLHS